MRRRTSDFSNMVDRSLSDAHVRLIGMSGRLLVAAAALCARYAPHTAFEKTSTALMSSAGMTSA
jgi:hypothetical protein